ncbi:SusC/RagA family TonB-linked outer membrane protein [Cyclobacterium salsum]|uniref:SusC/RagA family TonB-linked outer membrane protein n=1 Tax=Cyclobacterium salsum TaxID=2666329 RepID=UPI001390E733|nr:TonB-dependent receptor [Cyclobacterium salsum]
MKQHYALLSNRGKRLSDSCKWRKPSIPLKILVFSLITTIFCWFPGNFANAQQGTQITGQVFDNSSKESLPGVNILIKGTSTGTVTDIDGSYSIRVPNEDVELVYSFVGYLTQEIRVGNRTTINVDLVADQAQLEEVVVVGYGTVKKSDLTGSVVRVDPESFKNQSNVQLTDMLAGTVAGFNANQGTSAAGGSSLEVRGPTSLSAGTEPLVVLDGVIFNGSLRDINPNDIESVDILKDASSAAVFGARAASGVILVTTTRGKTGAPTINFTTKLGVAGPTNDDFAVRGPQGYLDFRRDYFRTLGQAQPDYHWFNPEELPEGVTLEQWRASNNNPNPDNTREWLSRLNFFPDEVEAYLAGETIDWRDKVMKPGMRQEYDLSVGGGTEKIKYYWSLGYLDNEGIIVGDKFSTIRSRINFDFQVTDWMKVGLNSQFSSRDESVVQANLTGMYQTGPYAQMYEEDGSIKWFPHGYIGGQNPLINYLGQDRFHKRNNFFNTLFTEFKLPFGITFRSSYQPRIESVRDYNYWSPETITGGQTYAGGRATRFESNTYEWMVDNLLKWNREFGIHNFDVTILYNLEKNRIYSSSMANQTFLPSAILGYHGMQFGGDPTIETDDITYTGEGLMGRVNYTLMEKYLFTGSIRRDGFSAFGRENPRAIFPALAFAWQISDETFYNSSLIDQLKMRLSWGVNGNRDIGPYSSFAQMGSNQYYNGSQVQMGIFTSTLSNPGLSWEETESYNLGFDIGILANRINLTLDYYDMSTENLLVDRSLPRVTGFENVTTNIGELANRGFEATVGAVAVNRPNFNWRTNINYSMNRNEIISLFGDTGEYTLQGQTITGEIPDFENEWFIGQPIDVVWDYDILGTWQVEEAQEAAEYNLDPGDIKADDLDDNGVYEALQDKKFIGFSQPRHRIGFRNDITFLRDFTASIFIRADLGHMRAFTPSVAGWSTFDRRSTANYPYWTPDNRTNDYPRLSVNDSPFGGGVMPYKSSSFVRIQDLSLSYNLPTAMSQRYKMQNFRIFGSVRNLYTFSSWPGWDPESGLTPMPRIVTVGFNLTL